MNLNFVTGLPGISLNLWSPQRPSHYAEACALGRGYAVELVDYLQSSGNPMLFGAVIRAIASGGEFGGVEAGFCSEIGQMLAVQEG